MNLKTELLLVLLFVLTQSNAFTNLAPAGKELIYDYHARIRLGTFEPAEFASQFILDGKLHMQNDEKSILMRFSDLKFKLYNGEINGAKEKESLALELPEEAKDLLKPFLVAYNDDGKAKHLSVDEHDPIFSRNVKKAIASIMQLDMKEIQLDSESRRAFESIETDIYGEGLVHYNVMPEDKDIVVQKMLNVLNSTHWYSYLDAINADINHKKTKLPDAMDSQRKYTLTKNDHGWHMKRIETHGGIFVNIMKGLSVSQQMSTLQRMQLLEIIPIKNKLFMSEKQVKEDLIFKRHINQEAESLPDWSFGRSGMTMELYEKYVLNVLDDMFTYLDEDQLTMEAPNIKKGQAVNRLHNLMGQLDVSTLEKIFSSLGKKTDDYDKKKFIAFQEMIPLIGTRASTMLIRNVIRNKKVNDEMAISMLQKMPFYLRMPSVKLLAEVEDLMELESASDSVRKAALLSFASLISEVHAQDFIHLNETNLKLSEKYVLKIMDKLKATDDYSLQYLYMHALFNIRFVSKHLEPYVKGEVTANHHLRYLAMCASLYEIRNDPDRVFNLYWPILTDHSQHLELRAFAYLTIMSARPSRGRLSDIYWLLRNEPCPDLYHLFYTHLTGIAQTTDQLIPLEVKVQAAQMLNSMHKPFRHPVTGFYSIDYIDPKYGFAAISNSVFIASNTSKSMYLDFSNELYSLGITYYSLWIKIDGIDETLLHKSPKQHMNPHIQMVMRMLSTLKDQKNIHIEYALVDHDKIVESNYFNHENIDILINNLANLIENILKKSLHISYDMMTEIVVPNDLGFLTMVQYRMPRIRNNEISITNEKTDDMLIKHVEIKLQTSQHSALEMITFNPFVGFWQGTHRVQLYDMIMPLDIKLAMSKQLNDFKITINRHNDEKKGAMGVRTLARSSVSATIGDRHNLLKESSKISEPFAEVTRGSKYKKTKMFFEHDCIHTGLKYQIAAFDTELPISRRNTMMLLKLVSQQSFKNARTTPEQLLLTIRDFLAHIVLAPRPETFGFIIRGIPSTVHPVDKIELSMRVLKSSHQPNMKLSTHATFSTKTKEDKIINQWDFDLLREESFDHILKNFNLQYTRVQPEKENFRVCIEGKKEWTNNELNGHTKVTMGHTADPKLCADNEGTVEISMKGQQSDEQRKLIADHITYRECSPSNIYEPTMRNIRIPQHELFECIKKQTSVRRYEYEIKINGVPQEKIEKMYVWIDYFKAMLLPYYSLEKVEKTSTDNNTRKIIIEYPIAGNEININVLKNENIEKLVEAPTKYLSYLGFHSDTYHFSPKFLTLHHWGLTESCFIDKEKLLSARNKVSEIHDEDWMQLAHNNPEVQINHTLALFIKKNEGPKHMALRMIMNDQKLEITPTGEELQITLNEKPLVVEKGSYHNEPLFGIGRLQDTHHTTVLHVFRIGLYIAFDGEQIIMEKPKLYKSLAGTCFGH